MSLHSTANSPGRNVLQNLLQVTGLLALPLTAYASSLPPPTGPANSPTGTYTIYYQYTAETYICTATYLEERPAGETYWSYVPNSDGAALIVDHHIGLYEYRTRIECETPYSEWDIASDSITVQVGETPTVDSLEIQLQYEYITRIGDINGDGLEDIFIDRTTEADAGNGSLDTVLLTQDSGGMFQTSIPSSAQFSTASSWSAANINLSIGDYNLDGFVDIFLRELQNEVFGALSQIIFAPGQIFQTAPKGIASLDSDTTQFLAEFRSWAETPTYFDDNAIWVEYWHTETEWDCGWFYWGDQLEYECTSYTVWVDDSYWSYDHFNQNALQFALEFGGTNYDMPLPAGSSKAAAIEAIFEAIFGVDVFGGILSSGGIGGWEIEIGVDNDDDRGRVLIWQIFEISEETADPNDWRFLTWAEKELVLDNGIQIPGVDGTRLYNKGYKLVSFLTLGVMSDQVIAPNGNVYIPTPNNAWGTGFPWSADYTLETYMVEAQFLHELFHVYQHNSKGLNALKMFKWRTENASYYYDYVEGKDFEEYGMEQQATMVMDRYLLRMTGSHTYHDPNITLVDLESVLPFEWLNP